MSEQEFNNTWKESKEYKQTAALLEKAQQAEPSKIMGVYLSVYTIQPAVSLSTVAYLTGV